MAVDQFGEDSKRLQTDPLIAAGGNSTEARRLRVKSQLRDRYGRWVEMGRDSKVKIRFGGKIIDVIGKFVGGSDREGYGRFLVKNDPNGVPDGVYHFKGAALNQILASLDPAYLKDKGIKLNRDVNGNLIGDVLDKDIEDFDSIKREEIGSLDEALSTGDLDDAEKSEEALTRQTAKAYISKNVVADLPDASKDDVAEGAKVVEDILGKKEYGSLREAVDDFIKEKGGFVEAAEELLKDNPSNARGLRESANFVKTNGYSTSDDTDELYDAFKELRGKDVKIVKPEDAKKTAGDGDNFDSFVKNSGGYEDAAKRLLAKNPSNADDLRESIGFMQNNGYSAEEDRDVISSAYEELKSKGQLPELPSPSEFDNIASAMRSGFPSSSDLDGRLENFKKALDSGNFAEIAKTARSIKDLTAGDLRNNPEMQGASNAIRGFLDRHAIDSASPEVYKNRREVAKANATAQSKRNAIQKWIKDQNKPIEEIIDQLIDDGASNKADLESAKAFKRSNGYLEEDDSDAIDSAIEELYGDDLSGKTRSKEIAESNKKDEARRQAINDWIRSQNKPIEDVIDQLIDEGASNKAELRDTKAFKERTGYLEESDSEAIDKAIEELHGKELDDAIKLKPETLDEKLDKFIEDRGGFVPAAKELLKNNPSNAADLKESVGFVESNGYSTEDDRDAIYKAFKELYEGEKEKPSAESTAKKVLDATGVDLTLDSDDESHAQARDALLYTSDLIDNYGGDDEKEELHERLATALIDHLNNKQSGTHGAKKFAGKADTIQKITERKEGSTLDPFSLSQPRKGIAVALDGRNEEVVDTIFFDEKLGNLVLADYIEKNKDKFDGTFKLGTWHDRDNNEVTLDVVELFPEGDRENAIAAGQQRNQQGIFKLSNKEYIDTGGTGDRGRARRQREQARRETDFGLGIEPRRVESTKPAGEGAEGVLPERANSSRNPELAAIPERRIRKFDTGEEKYDSYELTGDRVVDTLAMLDLGQDDMLSEITDPEKKKAFEDRFTSIREKLNSGERFLQDEAINEIVTLGVEYLNVRYSQEPGMEYSTGTEISRGLVWHSRSVGNLPYPAEVSAGMRAFLPDLEQISSRIIPSEESKKIDAIVADIREIHERRPTGSKGYFVEEALSRLKDLEVKLAELVMRGYHGIGNDNFDDEEWIDLKPIKNRIADFLSASVKGWKPEDYVTTTVKPQIANTARYNYEIAEEILPEIENKKDEPWAIEISSAIQEGSDPTGAVIDAINSLNSEENPEKNAALVEKMQRVVNSNKKIKKAYRPTAANGSKNPDPLLPENPGSEENPNVEPESELDSLISETPMAPMSHNELLKLNKTIGAKRAAALQLNVRGIDRTKLSERQRKVLTTMISQRNKALKSLELASSSENLTTYEKNYYWALACTDAIKRLVGNAETYGESYNFGSGEKDRAQNFVILEDSIVKTTRTVDGEDKEVVTAMTGYYTSKSGKTYLMQFSGNTSEAYTLSPLGLSGNMVGYVRNNFRAEQSRGPEYPSSSTPGYLKTNSRYGGEGIAGANITFSRLAYALSGEHYSHSGGLTYQGANNSKGIDPNDPQRHHLSQQEKVLQLMKAPAIELLERTGCFSGELFNFGPYTSVSFGNFLQPLDPKGRSHGAGSMTGILYSHDNALKTYFGNARTEQRKHILTPERVSPPRLGIDYPEFAKQHVTSEKGDISSWGLQHLLTEMSYKDGISKEEGIKILKERRQQLLDWQSAVDALPPNDAMRSGTPELGRNATIKQYVATIDRIIKGLEDFSEFDSKRIDRPEPFDVKAFKMYKQKPYGDVDPKNEQEFDFGYPKASILNYKKDYARWGGNSEYLEKYGTTPPENWTNYAPSLAKRFTSEELKDAIEQSFSGEKIDMEDRGWGVQLDFAREFADNPVIAPVQLGAALRALHLQGVDTDKFFAELIDKKNGNNDVSDAIKEKNAARISLLDEIDEVLKANKIRKTSRKKSGNADSKSSSYGNVNGVENVLTPNNLDNRNWGGAGRLTSASPTSDFAPLIDNEKFDYSDGREDVLGEPSRQSDYRRLDREAGLDDFATTNPAYFAIDFKKEDLIKAFEKALEDENSEVRIQFFSGHISQVPLSSIRDALQYLNVDTNALARKVFSTKQSRSERDALLKPQGKIVPRSAEEVVQHAEAVVDIANFELMDRRLDGINSPNLYRDPATGKFYIVKALYGSDPQAAVDNEIATQAFLRSMGIYASAPQRGIDSSTGQNNFVVSEFIEASPDKSYSQRLLDWSDNSVRAAMFDTIIGELFVDHIDGSFNPGNVLIDADGNPIRIDGGGGLLRDPVPDEGTKAETDRFTYGGYENGATQEQDDLRQIAKDTGSFEGQGIEFGFDFYLNPNGWHWNVGTRSRKEILNAYPASEREERLKKQAEEMLLNNMTPDKIDKISRLVRNPLDRAIIADTLIKRRKRILERFGIEDTYNERMSNLLNRVPDAAQVNRILDNIQELMDLRPEQSFDEYSDRLAAPDMNSGKATDLIIELENLKNQIARENRRTAEELAEKKRRETEEKLADATPDTSDFPTNGDSDEVAPPNAYVLQNNLQGSPTLVSMNADGVPYGARVHDDEGNFIGQVLIKGKTQDGEDYLGLIDENRNFVEAKYDFGVPALVDVSVGGRAGGGVISDSVIPPNSPRSSQQGIDFAVKMRARSNAVIEEIKSKYPAAKRLPNGDLVIASTTKTEPTRLRRTFKYDVVVHRKPNEKFVTYVRRTQIDAEGNAIGDTTVGRISPETHSARHLNNRITPLLGGGRYKGILADFPQNWFNNSQDLQREVIHPSTRQPIPISLAPRNYLNAKYIGNTGIEETGDPIKDALISHVADLVDRAVDTASIARRLNNQSVLTKSQVADITERIQANRIYPGVNQVPYVSRDDVNIVRIGDRVRHYHPDGSTRTGVVIGRNPLMVYQKAPGEYAYTDVLRVRFDDGTRSPIVAKNLEILRRSDGSTPEIRPLAEQRRQANREEPYAKPSGLVDGFSVRDTDSVRSFRHSSAPVEHSQGKIFRTLDAVTGENKYVAAGWERGANTERDVPNRSRTFADKNIAQEWLISLMNKYEERYGQQRASSPVMPSPVRNTPPNDTELPEMPDESGSENYGVRVGSVDFIENPDGSVLAVPKDVSGVSEAETPLFKIGFDKKKNSRTLVVYPDAESAKKGSGISIPVKKNASIDEVKNKIAEETSRFVNYRNTGPHEVMGVEVGYEEFREMMVSPVSSKYFRDPVNGQSIISPERLQEYIEIIDERVPESIKPTGKQPRIFFFGGGPGAGKSGLTLRGLFRADDPVGFKKSEVPTFDEYDERGGMKPRSFDGTPEAVMVNPDDFKLALKEGASMNFRVRHSKDGNMEQMPGDDAWAGAVHEESSLLSKIALKVAAQRGLDIIFDGTGDSTVAKLKKKLDEVKKSNPDYKTIGHYMNTDPVKAIARAVMRAESSGRSVKLDVQLKTFMALAEMLSPRDLNGNPKPNILSNFFDEFVLYDNRATAAGEAPEIIGHSSDGSDFMLNEQNENAVPYLASLTELLALEGASDDDPRNAGNILADLERRGQVEIQAERRRRQEAAAQQKTGGKMKSSPDSKAVELSTLNTVMAATGMTKTQLGRLGDGKVLAMITRGVPVQSILNYIRSINNG